MHKTLHTQHEITNKMDNLCGTLTQTIFSWRVSFTRSPENTPIELIIWFGKQDNPKGNVSFNKKSHASLTHWRLNSKGMERILKWSINHNIR
jgi:hypothetical protein